MAGRSSCVNLLVDIAPLRESKMYRRLYFGGFFGALGGQATFVATAFQLKEITHSAFAVGALGIIELLPLIVAGLYGGVMADRFDRKKIIIVTEATFMLAALGLMFNALSSHPQAWVIYFLDAFIVSSASLQSPSWSALNQSLVRHEHQNSAAVLGSIKMTATSIVGPALGGLLVVSVGPSWAFGLNAAMYLISLPIFISLHSLPKLAIPDKSDTKLFQEGIQYTRSRPDILGTYCIDLVAMAFAYPVVMLPFVAAKFDNHFALSLLYAALPFGALVATLLSAWTKKIHFYGRALVASAILWGLGIAVFGFSSQLWVAFVALAFAGGADAMSAVFRQTHWNQSIPPEMRGRMGGVELLSYAIGPMTGSFRAGAMAAWTSLRFSLTFGGLGCAGAVGAVAFALPALWNFDVRTNENVAFVKQIRSNEEHLEP